MVFGDSCGNVVGDVVGGFIHPTTSPNERRKFSSRMLDAGDRDYLEVFEREGAAPETSGEANILHFALRCDDCVGATELARAAGAKVTMEPKVADVFTQIGLKTKISFVSGPDGEIVEFFESSDL